MRKQLTNLISMTDFSPNSNDLLRSHHAEPNWREVILLLRTAVSAVPTLSRLLVCVMIYSMAIIKDLSASPND